MMQAGYGFSSLHSWAYTLIGYQEAWIYTKYHRVYWNTACLTVNASAGTEDVFDDTKAKTTNYGKIAKAIGDIQTRGITVLLPDINKSDYEFTPDSNKDEIIYGLTPISGINSEIACSIIENRPYVSLEDFHKRMTLEKKKVIDANGKEKSLSLIPSGKVITLIKSGAFDNVCGDRVQTMKNYIRLIHPPKTKVNFQNFESLLNLDLIPEDLNLEVRLYKFYKFITKKDNIIEHDIDTKSKKWYNININDSINSMTELFFEEHLIDKLKEDVDYRYEPDGTLSIFAGSNTCGFDKLIKEKYSNLTKCMSSKACIESYNNKMFDEYWNKYTDNNDHISKWEMDSVVFYYHEHELKNVNQDKYEIVNYFDLSEDPEIIGYNEWKNNKYPKYQLYRICGTVLDKDAIKHTVSLLTVNGVVNIKYQAGQYTNYDKQVSYLDNDGKKVVIESSWFSRGTMLCVAGYRKGGRFVAKKYRDSIWSNTTVLIENIKPNGDLIIKSERSRV